MSERVRIFDTTLRDGEQSPGCSMNLGEKLAIARQLERLGVDVIEAGLPDRERGRLRGGEGSRAGGARRVDLRARAHGPRGRRARRARARGRRDPRIHTFIATSDIHLHHKLRMSRQEVLAEVDRAVRQAKGYVDDVEFSAEDATRSDWDYLVEVFTVAIAAGARTLNVPDTVGYTQPDEYARLIRHLRAKVPCGRCDLQRPLSQRPRARRLEQPRRRARGRAPGRVHRERDRRARRQHLARRGGDGDPDAARRVRGHRHRDRRDRDLPVEPAARFDDRRSRAAEQGDRRATTRSRTRPASTRTACSRPRSPTRS
jgi:hypothetical protein